MSKAPLSPLLWDHLVTDIPANGLKQERAATEGERAALSTAFDVLGFDSAVASYRVTALAGGGYQLKGSVDCSIRQACVVTLEPLTQALSETFDVEFWPSADDDADEGGDLSVLDGPDVDVLENQTIPAGRIVFETISAAIDPFPRKDGAQFEAPDPAPKTGATISPFSALAKLKNKD
jgi:uncharacterized metal-binding protein YceD (DUF177 family)